MATSKVRLSAAETRQRERVVAETIHAHAVEGIELDADTLAQLDLYVAGERTTADLVEWARGSVGLTA